MVSRATRTPFAAWWWTVDRLMLAAVITVMLGGIVLSLAASPPVAARLGLDPFYFVNRHILYLLPALAVMVGVSFLSPRQIRRLALVVFAVSFVLVVATLFFGAEVKGARRWIVIAGVNIQPSEFLKPAFVILIAWLFAESARKPDVPANTMALALLIGDRDGAGAATRLRPDHADRAGVGRAVLHGRHADGLGGRARRRRHARARRAPIRRCRMSRAASSASSIRPPATRSRSIPRSNRSCAAAGSAAGRARARSSASCPTATPTSSSRSRRRNSASCSAWSCVALFAFIVLRALHHAMRNEDPFARFATAGLAILFGTQSAINMAVNLALIPAKGMTLPFISYGGSSMISLAYGMGMLLALTREAAARRTDDSRASRLALGGAARPECRARRAAGRRCRRRHRRASVSRRGAERRAGACAVIAVDLATDERATRYGAAFPARAIHVIPSATVRAQQSADVHHRAGAICAGARCALDMLWRAQACRRDRLRRLSDRAAAAGRRALREFRPSSTSRTRSWAAPTACWRRSCARSPRAFPACSMPRPQLAAKATHTGNPVRPAVIAAAKTPYAAAEPTGRCACWCSAAARARGSWPISCRPRSSCCRRPLRARLCDRAAGARRRSAARARHLRAARDQRPRSRRSSPICRRASRRLIWWCRAPALRPSRNSPPSAGPAILVPLPHALDQDQFANAGCWKRPAAPSDRSGRLHAETAGGRDRRAGQRSPKRLAAMAAGRAADRSGRRRRPAGRSGHADRRIAA